MGNSILPGNSMEKDGFGVQDGGVEMEAKSIKGKGVKVSAKNKKQVHGLQGSSWV